jgi:hypothetical protein
LTRSIPACEVQDQRNSEAEVLRLPVSDRRKILQPFDKRECLSLKEAAGIAGKSESTMHAWVEQHGLGRRIGGGTVGRSVGRVALAMFLDGDERAGAPGESRRRSHE